ncbi:hypothetical protein T492DRAFT_965496 [Pavlovales sp. CCMP2436]|nr:hypothetical protein T492DRAFT_965496 [Pavlovales sp. CCMP2436]
MYCSQIRPMLIAIATVVSVSLRMDVDFLKTAGTTDHSNPSRVCAYVNGLRSTITCSNLTVKVRVAASGEHDWTCAIATPAPRGRCRMCPKASSCVTKNPASRALVHVRSATSAQRIRTQAQGSTKSARHTPSSPRQTHSSSGLVSERARTAPSRKHLATAVCWARARFCCSVRPLRTCVCTVPHARLCLFIALVDPKSLSHSEHSTPGGERVFGVERVSRGARSLARLKKKEPLDSGQ